MKMVVTAELRNWWEDSLNNVLWGYIYNDTRKRWPDGTRIHTSVIPKYKDITFRKGMRIRTLNSVYLLGKKLRKRS